MNTEICAIQLVILDLFKLYDQSHYLVTHRTDGQSLLGERRSAEQQGLLSNCPTHSFAQCLSSSESQLMISARDKDTLNKHTAKILTLLLHQVDHHDADSYH